MGWFYGLFKEMNVVEFATLLGVYACLFLLLTLLTVRLFRRLFSLLKARKTRRIQAKRRLRYTLPDERNDYVKSRLHTALRAEEGEKYVNRESVGVRLRYAKKMLALLKESPLSPVERLDVEELDGVIAAYQAREKWSSEDVKAVGEIFARLLKLSAKYEIAV